MCRDGSACNIGDEVGLGEDILPTKCSTDQGRVLDVRTRSRIQLERVFTELEGKACQPASRSLLRACYDYGRYHVQYSQVLQST